MSEGHGVVDHGPGGGGLDIAFFGSSLVSSWWNGACTYYRGIIRGLHERGHRVTFYEPIAYQRQEHRDIPDPDYARVVIYPAEISSCEDDWAVNLWIDGSGRIVAVNLLVPEGSIDAG